MELLLFLLFSSTSWIDSGLCRFSIRPAVIDCRSTANDETKEGKIRKDTRVLSHAARNHAWLFDIAVSSFSFPVKAIETTLWLCRPTSKRR